MIIDDLAENPVNGSGVVSACNRIGWSVMEWRVEVTEIGFYREW